VEHCVFPILQKEATTKKCCERSHFVKDSEFSKPAKEAPYIFCPNFFNYYFTTDMDFEILE
jgi:hypothetical protein